MISRQPTPDGFDFFVFEVEDPVAGLEIQIQAQEVTRFLVAFDDFSHAVGNKVSLCHLWKITLAINAATIRDRNEGFERHIAELHLHVAKENLAQQLIPIRLQSSAEEIDLSLDLFNR